MHRVFDGFHGLYGIEVFRCFVAKGSKVKEGRPKRTRLQNAFLVSEGQPDCVMVEIKVCRYVILER